jgi:hypothetical protein
VSRGAVVFAHGVIREEVEGVERVTVEGEWVEGWSWKGNDIVMGKPSLVSMIEPRHWCLSYN